MKACLLWLSLAALGHAAAVEPGVVEVVDVAPDPNEAWYALLAKKGQATWAADLEAWLQRNPRGPQASLALYEQAALQDDLDKAVALLRKARTEGEGSEAGSAAALELARLEYALERTESALTGLEEAEAWPRAEALQAEWLYWKAQSRLVLKGFKRARDDFQHLAAGWPKSARAQAALLGQAECDAALKEYARAEAVLEPLAQPASALAAQALWAWAGVKAKQGKGDEARRLYLRLKQRYPASFEAASVDAKLAELPLAVPTATPRPASARRWLVQVGAFSRKATADKLAIRLRKARYPVLVQSRRVDGRTLFLVKTGPYKTKALADAHARRLSSREKLPQRIVEE